MVLSIGFLAALFLFFALLLASFVLVIHQTRKVRLNGRVYPTLAKFLEQFGAEIGLKGEPIGDVWFRGSPEHARFSGTLANGRRARVTFVDHYDWNTGQPLKVARVAVSCDT